MELDKKEFEDKQNGTGVGEAQIATKIGNSYRKEAGERHGLLTFVPAFLLVFCTLEKITLESDILNLTLAHMFLTCRECICFKRDNKRQR